MRLSKEPLIPAVAIERRVVELAQEISKDFSGRELLVVAVLKGGVIFAADLMRQLRVPAALEFIRAKSYGDTTSTGTVEFMYLPRQPVSGKQVLIVEDILDTGRTTAALCKRLEKDRPARLALCTLLDKPARREVPVSTDYVGFTIDDHFVVGYGLDWNERYRQLPDIWTLEA